MGDEDDGLPVSRHGPHRREKALSLLGGQHRRGFVQDEDANPPVQELQDLDPLLFPDRELPDGGLGRHFQAVAASQLCHLTLERPARGNEPRLGVTQREVLGHGEAVHQPEVLVDHAHPVF